MNKSEGKFSAFPEPGKSRVLMEQQISKSPLLDIFLFSLPLKKFIY